MADMSRGIGPIHLVPHVDQRDPQPTLAGLYTPVFVGLFVLVLSCVFALTPSTTCYYCYKKPPMPHGEIIAKLRRVKIYVDPQRDQYWMEDSNEPISAADLPRTLAEAYDLPVENSALELHAFDTTPYSRVLSVIEAAQLIGVGQVLLIGAVEPWRPRLRA